MHSSKEDWSLKWTSLWSLTYPMWFTFFGQGFKTEALHKCCCFFTLTMQYAWSLQSYLAWKKSILSEDLFFKCTETSQRCRINLMCVSFAGIDHFDDIGPCVILASPGMMQSGLSRLVVVTYSWPSVCDKNTRESGHLYIIDDRFCLLAPFPDFCSALLALSLTHSLT